MSDVLTEVQSGQQKSVSKSESGKTRTAVTQTLDSRFIDSRMQGDDKADSKLAEDKKERWYGELFPEAAEKVGKNMQRKLRVHTAYSRMAREAFETNIGMLNATVQNLGDKIPLLKKSESQKKLLQFLDAIKGAVGIIDTKLKKLQKMLFTRQKREAISKLGDNPKDNEEAVGTLARNCSDLNRLVKMYSDIIGIMESVSNEELSDGELDYFTKLFNHDFFHAESDDKDYDTLMGGELSRAKGLLGVLKGGSDMDQGRFILPKDYIDGLTKAIEAENSIEEADKELGFSGENDLLKISKKILPAREKDTLNATEWQQDVLMSARFQTMTIRTLLAKQNDDTTVISEDEKGLLSAFGDIYSLLDQIGQKVTRLADESDVSGEKADEMFARSVKTAGYIGTVCGHMREIYGKLLKRKENYGEEFSFAETQNMLKLMVSSMSKSVTGLKIKNYDEACAACEELAKNANLALTACESSLDEKVYDKDEYGIELGMDFTDDSLQHDSVAEDLIKAIRKNIEAESEMNERTSVTKARLTQIRKDREENAGRIAELEKEKKRLLEQEKAAKLLTNAQKTRIRYDSAALNEKTYLPKTVLGEISEFTDYSGKKIEKVSKPKAFFDKNKLKGNELKGRMEKHVRRFLSRREGVTDDEMAKFSDIVADSSQVIKKAEDEKGLDENQRKQIEVLEALRNAKDADDIMNARLTAVSAKVIPARADKNEAAYDSKYFKDHPNAQKIVLMHKVLSTMALSQSENATEEWKGRIDALQHNVGLLYSALIQSPEYREQVRAQRISEIEGDIENRRGVIRRLDEEILHYTPKSTLDDYTDIIKAQKEEFSRLVKGTSDAVKTRLEQKKRAERLRNVEKTDKELRSSISVLEKSIRESEWRLLKEKKSLLLRKEDKKVKDAMQYGALHYLRTLLVGDVLKDIPVNTRNEIFERIKAGLPSIMPADKSDITQCTADDVRVIAVKITGYLRRDKDLAQNLAHDGEYRTYFLDHILTGESFVSFDDYVEYKKDRQMKAEKADALLSRCSFYRKDKPAVVRISALKKSSAVGSSKHMRGVNRLERMQELGPFVREIFGKAQKEAPMTVYEFKKEKIRQADEDVKSAKANSAQDSKKVKEAAERKKKYAKSSVSDFRKSYEEYIAERIGELKSYYDEQNKGAKKEDALNPFPMSFMGKEYSDWKDIEKLIRDNYSEYGVEHEAAGLSEILGNQTEKGKPVDYLNDVDHSKYLDKLAEAEEKLLEEKAKALDIDPEQYKKEITRLNGRLAYVGGLYGGSFPQTFDLMVDDDRFREHIIADTDAEFEIYLAKIMPSCRRITDAIDKHLYIDQYMIERKEQILNYILTGSDTDVDNLLKLDEIDRTIEDYNIDGKTFFKTMNEAIGAQAKSGEGNSMLGSLVVEQVLKGGASAILSKGGLKRHKERVEKNLEQLEAAFDEIVSKLPEGTFNKEALKKSLLLTERNNLFRSRNEVYSQGLVERLEKDVKVILEAQKQNHILTEQNKEKKDVAAILVENKIEGRRMFNELFRDTDKEFDELGDPGEADIPEECKKGLIEVSASAKEYMSDEFLGTLYTTMLKRMAAHSIKKDVTGFNDDRNILLRAKAFSQACDEYLAGSESHFAEADKKGIKKGLFELYGSDIVAGRAKDIEKRLEGVDYYKNLIKELLDQVDGGLGAAKYIIDDEGGLASMSYEQARGERKEQTKERNSFEVSLKEKLDRQQKKKLDEMTNDEKLLLYHLLGNRTQNIGLRNVIARLTGQDENDAISVNEDAVVFSYLKGEELTGSIMEISYHELSELLKDEKIKANIQGAFILFEELRRTKNLKLQKKESEIQEKVSSTEIMRMELAEMKSTADAYVNDIKENKRISNKEKLWRFYTVLRTYSNVFDRYHSLRNAGQVDDLNNEFGQLPEVYGIMQEYFAVGDQSELSRKKLYSMSLCLHLGIYTEEEFKKRDSQSKEEVEAFNSRVEQMIEEDSKREKLQEMMRGHLYKVTGEHAQSVRKVADEEEASYPEDVVEAAKKIDRWVAQNALVWKGDSESNFGIDILGRPLRDRLFVYYTIEKEKTSMPTGLDAALAINNYMPDPDVFRDKIERSRLNLLHRAASGLKQYSIVRKTSALDTYGAVNIQMLEGSIRMLDDRGTHIREYIERLSKERQSVNMKDMPEAVRVRQGCYLAFMSEVERQKRLVEGKSDDANKNDPKVIRQSGRVKRALRRLVHANEEVAALTGEDITGDELRKLSDKVDTTIVRKEDDPLSETIVSWTGELASAGNSVSEVLDKGQEVSLGVLGKIHPWKFSEVDLTRLMTSQTVFHSVTIVTSLVDTVMKAKAASDENMSHTSTVTNTAEAVENMGDVVENICNLVSFLQPGLEDTAEGFSDGFGAALTIMAGTMRTVSAIDNYRTVSGSRQEALKYADEITSTEQQADKPEEVPFKKAIENVSNMQMRTEKALAQNNALKTAGGVVSLIGAIVPGAATVTTVIGGLITVATKIHGFWKNKEQREKTVDEFIDMDKMYADFKEESAGLDYGIEEKYGKSESDIKKSLRMEAMISLHFSTIVEFFSDITTKYAQIFYRHIFFKDDGDQILSSDVEEIRKRKPLFDMFPNLKFGFPGRAGEWPSPSMENLAHDLMREV